MTTQAPPSNLLPLSPEQMARLQAATTDFTPTQLAWVSGYFWGVLNQHSGAAAAAPEERGPAWPVPIVILPVSMISPAAVRVVPVWNRA